jgi:hypothetical protein
LSPWNGNDRDRTKGRELDGDGREEEGMREYVLRGLKVIWME